MVAGRETDVLALGLVGRRQPGAPGPLAHGRLGELAEGQQQALEGLGRHAPQHVRLVLVAVATAGDVRRAGDAHDARVVAGRHPARPEAVGQHDAAAARRPGLQAMQGFGVSPARYAATNGATTSASNRGSSFTLKCGAADGVRAFPGARHGRRRTAAPLVVSRPELQGGGPHLVAGLAQEEGGHGAVDAAAQAYDDAFFPSTFATSPARPALVR